MKKPYDYAEALYAATESMSVWDVREVKRILRLVVCDAVTASFEERTTKTGETLAEAIAKELVK